MNKLQIQVHEYLKSKYQKATGKDMLCQKTLSPTRSKYYFENLEDNLYEKMSDRTRGFFEAGSGEELKDKMFALRSSSAMTFNLLGNDSITVKPNNLLGAGEYRIEYEKQLDTLQKSKALANLDALLEKADEICFCEMKLFEPLYHKTSFQKELPSSYEDMERYIYLDSAYSFKESIEKLKASGIKRYDACQMFKHTLGIYNYARKNELKGKKITLLNCIWTLNESLGDKKLDQQYNQIALEERNEFNKFIECMFNPINAFSKFGIDFSIKLITEKDLESILNISEEKRKWLKRY